ncbi:MAG TPA: DUF2339 domain-containing protein [Candidatus Sulfotelmatobacter sp.]|nr:DUF2339 domain-containing protein [Candidatus Sulfotelmatobacter sp.]
MDSPQSELQAIRQLLAELTNRVYRIEQRLGIDASPSPPEQVGMDALVRPAAQSAAAPSPPPRPPTPLPRRPSPVPASLKAKPDLESRIGSHWLNRIGIAALLVGVSYFLKFAFDNNWIGPTGRITIGVIAGIAIVVWSERFRLKNYKAFSYSLKAVGIGTLYLSLWAAFHLYSLVPSSIAFTMMLIVTGATSVMALRQDAEILAAFALIGGFVTPSLLSTGENREVALFTYVAILDLATLMLVVFKPWRRLLVMSYAGTLILYLGWYWTFYNRGQLSVTLAYATVFFVFFAIAPLITLQPDGEDRFFAAIPAVLAFVNAGVYFLEAYAMIEEVNKVNMAWFALALAAVYIFLSRQVHARTLHTGTSEILYFLHLAVAIGFITIAIPIRLDAHWITVGWFIEAGVLLWIASRVDSDFLNAFALAAIVLGVTRLLFIDNFHTSQLVFNLRMATYAVAIAVLGAVAWFSSRRQDDTARTIGAMAVVALNVLSLVALSWEVRDYYAREMASLSLPRYQWKGAYEGFRSVEIARDFTYSALWMAYGAMLMIVGFLRRSAFVRWLALILIAITIVKVFVYDVSQLERGYRIISFIVLGILLLAISFVYQRDWLKLSSKNKPEPPTGVSTTPA